MKFLDIYAICSGFYLGYSNKNNIKVNTDLLALTPTILSSFMTTLNYKFSKTFFNVFKDLENNNKKVYDVRNKKYVNFNELDFRERNNISELNSKLENIIEKNKNNISKKIITSGLKKSVETGIGYVIGYYII